MAAAERLTATNSTAAASIHLNPNADLGLSDPLDIAARARKNARTRTSSGCSTTMRSASSSASMSGENGLVLVGFIVGLVVGCGARQPRAPCAPYVDASKP